MQAKQLFLSTSYIGKVTHRFIDIVSTNNYAKELIANGEPVHGSVILTDFQNKGRGQTGKFWHSSPGLNLLSTVILSPKSNISNIQFYLNKVIALSVASMVSKHLDLQVKIKWPNDILVNNQKIAGILIDNIYSGSLLQYSIVGIGLNINQQIFPEDLQHATSLYIESGLQEDVLDIAEQLFLEIEANYELLNGQFDQIDQAYHQLLFRKGEPNLFRRNGKSFIGTIQHVDEQGRLNMMVEQVMHTFRNQEIEYVF